MSYRSTGGSLHKALQHHPHGFPEHEAKALVKRMLGAVLYLHHNGVVHRDIKVENFMFDRPGKDAQLKLCDFGFAAHVTPDHQMMKGRMGTPTYMAPELWVKHMEYTSAVDMWAIGVTAYFLLSGTRPFHHRDIETKIKLIKEATPDFASGPWKRISSQAKDFCRQLLQKDPDERMTASEALNHPWIEHLDESAEIAASVDDHHIVDSLKVRGASSTRNLVVVGS